MDFFDRHKALIITSLLFAVLLLALYNFNLASNNKATAEMLIDLQQFKVEEKKEEPPKEENTPRQSRKVETHQAFNQDKEAREADFKSKLEEIFEKNSAKAEEKENSETNGNQGSFSVNKKNSEKKQTRSDGDNSNYESSQKSAIYDHSSISFSLKGRRAVKIPNPVYTCDTAGKVVINITVDESGFVTDVSINKGSSTSTNECLTERALQYAADARFTKLAGKNGQPGTITYYFKS
ncbi:TonB family protein [Christiangramia aquimixticola]|uniref:TonB family protein n=1 Tax=Christiangramia aquimixticola TaxID=1697558 RepID=UPI003AA87421